MELPDLNQDERTALVGLMNFIVMSDGGASEDEAEYVKTLVDAFGDDGYQRTLDTFEERFQDQETFKRFLKTIGRQEARDLIFGTVLEGAGEGALDSVETGLLDWLAQIWNVKIEIEQDPEQDSKQDPEV